MQKETPTLNKEEENYNFKHHGSFKMLLKIK